MNTKKSVKSLSLTAVTVIWTAAFAAGAFAQNTGADTAYVPFLVNVNAAVKATPAAGTASAVAQVQKSAMAGVEAVLRIPLPKSTGVAFGTQKQQNVPAVVSNHGGKISLSLSQQSYKNAEVSLFRVNGKRVLSLKTSASGAVSNISRRNVVAGAYLLSVRGADGAAFTSRITHGGGNLDISVAFVGENLSAPAQLTKANAAPIEPSVPTGSYRITVSGGAGYVDSSYMLRPIIGTNNLRQNITLRLASSAITFVDSRDGKVYRAVEISGKVWMAENLNYASLSGSWCYRDSPDSCNKYGRLYNWAAAKAYCPSGWHLPSRQEWGDLAKAVGGLGDYGASGNVGYGAGWVLRSQAGWYYDASYYPSGVTGTDEYGFSALPGGKRYCLFDDNNGYCTSEGGYNNSSGMSGDWWTATNGAGGAYSRSIWCNSVGLSEGPEDITRAGLSVRCVQNN